MQPDVDNKKIQKQNLFGNQFFILINFFYVLKLFYVSRAVLYKKKTTFILWSNLRQKTKIPKKIIFYSLENVYIVHGHIVASFLFLLQKKFYITHKHIVAF